MRERVLEELNRIERHHNVRILLAVESGSRAWGFASPDSDYDVRYIYAHDRDWYLSVFEHRDVIEEMLSDRLDINGWDLRKSLRLFSKCNLALNEWLGSPIIYSEAPGFRDRFVKMIPRYFNSIGAMHHYRSMADRTAISKGTTHGSGQCQRRLSPAKATSETFINAPSASRNWRSFVGIPSKSLHRMLIPNGNPSTAHFFEVFRPSVESWRAAES